MKTEDIHTLIERYFDGATSIDEERWLRENLPKMQGASPEIDEALAVMGYAAALAKSTARKPKTGHPYRWIASAAASLALILAAGGFYSYHLNYKEKPTFFAYAGGVKIDRQEAIRLITAQMEEMSEASRGIQADVEDDLADFRNIID